MVEALRALAKELSLRSVPKLLLAARNEHLPVSAKLAAEALKTRVPAQVLAPPPRSTGKVYAEDEQVLLRSHRLLCERAEHPRLSLHPSAHGNLEPPVVGESYEGQERHHYARHSQRAF